MVMRMNKGDIIIMLMVMLIMIMGFNNHTLGAMLWNQWCERKAIAMDFHQNEVGSSY